MFLRLRHYDSVAVSANTLYILNAQVKEKVEDPTEDDLRAEAAQAEVYTRIVGSFDVGRDSVA